MQDDDYESKVTPIRGGKRPPEHPIEELKAFMDKLFHPPQAKGGDNGSNGSGRSSGGGGAGFGPGSMRAIGLAFLALIVAWGAMTSFYTIDVSEEGVVTRLGAYNRTSPSGMHFKWPFGLEKVYKVQSKRILQEEFGFRTRDTNRQGSSSYDKKQYINESLMLTGDLNVADVEWIVQYRISDPWKYLFHARDVQRNIRDISLSIMRRVVGDRLVGDVLTTARVEIADQAKQLSQEIIDDYDFGIRIERIILQGVNPPEKVKPAFNEVNAAKQEQEKTINMAEREYNRVIPEARGKAEKVIADSEGYAIEIVNQAKGNVKQFEEILQAYRRAPEITKQRLYIDAMEEILSGGEGFTIIDSKLKGVMPIYALPGIQSMGTPAKTSSKTNSTGVDEIAHRETLR